MNVVEIINEAIASGRTRFAFELLPPLKGDGMQKIFAAVEPLMALDPAYVNITFHREGIKETEREDGSVDPERKAAYVAQRAKMAAMNIPGEPNDQAFAMLYLASDAAKFVTGQVLRPNGGNSMLW